MCHAFSCCLVHFKACAHITLCYLMVLVRSFYFYIHTYIIFIVLFRYIYIYIHTMRTYIHRNTCGRYTPCVYMYMYRLYIYISGWGRFVSFRFRFPGTGCLAFRFVGAYGSVRFAEMIGSFRFVSHLFNIFSVSFRFVSFRFRFTDGLCDCSEFA